MYFLIFHHEVISLLVSSDQPLNTPTTFNKQPKDLYPAAVIEIELQMGSWVQHWISLTGLILKDTLNQDQILLSCNSSWEASLKTMI